MQVEQIQMIFKLCGSPSEDYFKKLKLTTSYRPPQHYKASYQENFHKFPSSTQALLATLLDLNPTNRGSAASALQTQVCSSANANYASSCFFFSFSSVYSDSYFFFI